MIFGLYRFSKKENEAGIYISGAMAEEFSLPKGMMSERTLADFIMCSVGGVNGANIRYAEDVLLRKSSGEYIAVSCVPITENSNGYIQKVPHKPSKKHPPLSDMPNFAMISANVKKRKGDIFCVLHITPYVAYDAVSDYRCIAELFDTLRKKLNKPSIFWLGERDYIVAVAENEFEALEDILASEIAIGLQKIRFSVEMVYVPPTQTKKDAIEKLAFCVRKLKSGIKGGRYELSQSDFEEYKKSRKKAELVKKTLSDGDIELLYLPCTDMKSGYVRYFRVELCDWDLFFDCINNGCSEQLDYAIIDRFTKLLEAGEIKSGPFCISLLGDNFDEKKIKHIVNILKLENQRLFVEINARACRIDSQLAEKAKRIKEAGAVPVMYDINMRDFEICAIQRMGFSVIKSDADNPAVKSCADLCRTYNIACAVSGINSDADFIKMRRLGIDICSGAAVAKRTVNPIQTVYSQPHVVCEEEPTDEKSEKEAVAKDIDLTRFIVGKLYNRFGAPIKELVSPKPTESMENMDAMEKREPLTKKLESDLAPCELEEGIGVGKKRKKAKSARAQKKRQKKEIKKGRLKKVKLMKKEKK